MHTSSGRDDRVPPELIADIVGNLGSADLISMTTVSRVFQTETEKLLYRSVLTLAHTGTRLEAFLAAVLARPRRAAYVREVCIPTTLHYSQLGDIEALFRLQESLRNILSEVLPSVNNLETLIIGSAIGAGRFLPLLYFQGHHTFSGCTFHLKTLQCVNLLSDQIAHVEPLTWQATLETLLLPLPHTDEDAHFTPFSRGNAQFPTHSFYLPNLRCFEGPADYCTALDAPSITRLSLKVNGTQDLDAFRRTLQRVRNTLQHLKITSTGFYNTILSCIDAMASDHILSLTIGNEIRWAHKATILVDPLSLCRGLQRVIFTAVPRYAEDRTADAAAFADALICSSMSLEQVAFLDRKPSGPRFPQSMIDRYRMAVFRRAEDNSAVFEGYDLLSHDSWKTLP